MLEVSSDETLTIHPGHYARIISPVLPKSSNGRKKCPAFSMSVYGPHIGSVSVLDEYGRVQYRHQGSELNRELVDWVPVAVDLYRWQDLFVIEAVKGGRYDTHGQGDICIDDLSVVLGPCREYMNEYKKKYFTHHYVDFCGFDMILSCLFYIIADLGELADFDLTTSKCNLITKYAKDLTLKM